MIAHSLSYWIWAEVWFLERTGISSLPSHPDQLWDPSTLLSNGYRVVFPLGVKCQQIKLTIHLHLVLRLGMHGSLLSFPQYISMVMNLGIRKY